LFTDKHSERDLGLKVLRGRNPKETLMTGETCTPRFICYAQGYCPEKTGMREVKRYATIAGLVLVIAFLAPPAAAFTMDSLNIAVKENGDAEVTADYTLTWLERIGIFMRIAQPEALLTQTLEQYSGKDVTVTSVTPGKTVLSINDFAAVRQTGAVPTYITPTLDFSGVEPAVKSHRFSRFVSVDASPGLTVVSFPDGHQQVFYNVLVIPSITYTEGSSPGCC
jgi:hypothetical protein